MLNVIYLPVDVRQNSGSANTGGFQGIHDLTRRLEPNFDIERLCIKVVATWEGLQACRKLSNMGIRTLATTLFTMEQSILAAEAGCAYIAPFLHELKAFFDESYVALVASFSMLPRPLTKGSYHDGGAVLDLCLEAQEYYRKYGYATRVKAAGALSIDEATAIAGVDSLTIAPALLHQLSEETELEETLRYRSIFVDESAWRTRNIERLSFISDEQKFRVAFSKSANGHGAVKTKQVRRNKTWCLCIRRPLIFVGNRHLQ